DAELRPAAIRAVVIVVAEPGRCALQAESRVARADLVAFGAEEERPAALEHLLPAAVQVRPRDLPAPPDADVIGTLRASAAVVPVYEEDVVAAVALHVGRFDGVDMVRVRIVVGDPG